MRTRLILSRRRALARHSRLAVAGAAIATIVAFGATLGAQSAPRAASLDTRWFPWLGCWQIDSDAVSNGPMRTRLTCVVPTARSSTVDILSVVNGAVASRTAIDVTARSHAIDQPGCQGDETATWSARPGRLFLRSSYTCSGVAGISTRMFAISPSGDWLEIENIRANGGSIDHVTRRRNVGLSSGVPADIVRALDDRTLALATARAAVVGPATPPDVIEAVHSVDPSVVRAWLVATNSHYMLDGNEAAALVQADVPASVVQAMMGETRMADASAIAAGNRRADEYLRESSIANSGIVADGAAPVIIEAPMCGPDGYGCYSPNGYSAYNSYDYYSNGYGQYPSPMYPYAVSPFGSLPFSTFPITSFPFGGPVVIIRNRPIQNRNFPVHRGPFGNMVHGGLMGVPGSAVPVAPPIPRRTRP